MAINDQRKRMAAKNAGNPFITVLPLQDGSIEDEDRAMLCNLYLPGSFPPSSGSANNTKSTISGKITIGV
jgi:hypothetical protein